MTLIAHHCQDPLEGIDAEGCIVTGARRAAIRSDFWPLLEQATRHLARTEPEPSLYVYGSVATGMSRVGSSDVDLVTIGLDGAEAKRLATELCASHPGLCRGVEVGAAHLSDYEGNGDEAYGNRAFLRHYCVHLHGPDPACVLPKYRADAATARGFNGDIGTRAVQWRSELRERVPPSLSRRLARKTLFAVAGLVSIYDATWTTNRVASARRWGEIKPELADSLAKLVSWGFGSSPLASSDEIRAALDGVVSEVVTDFQWRIGLWRVDCDA